ncbi:MAG: hypothetical protein ABJA16_09260, partial [Nakamurella sp.]
VERRDVTAHLRAEGWTVVPMGRFLHLTTDGLTSIRLLSRREVVDATELSADIIPLQWPTRGSVDSDAIEA